MSEASTGGQCGNSEDRTPVPPLLPPADPLSCTPSTPSSFLELFEDCSPTPSTGTDDGN